MNKVAEIISDGLVVTDVIQILNYCVYEVTDDTIEYVCNFCGETFEFWDDAIIHVFEAHIDERVPSIDPAGDY
jgi:hypothetical protein